MNTSRAESRALNVTMPSAPDLLRLDERVLSVFGGFADVEDARVEFTALRVHQKERRAVRVHERLRVRLRAGVRDGTLNLELDAPGVLTSG